MTRLERNGDMTPPGESKLVLIQEDDGDMIVTVLEGEQMASVQFCTLTGGGHSPNTRRALVALLDALKQDEEADRRAVTNDRNRKGGPTP
jgi:hypothetical protein